MATDKTEPNSPLIAIFGILTVIGLFVSIFGLMAFFDLAHQSGEDAEGATANNSLAQLRSEENSKLLSYARDSATGKIQIPIDEAIKLEAQKPWRPDTPRPTPTPTPLPGQAPAPAAASGAPAPVAATPAPGAPKP